MYGLLVASGAPSVSSTGKPHHPCGRPLQRQTVARERMFGWHVSNRPMAPAAAASCGRTTGRFSSSWTGTCTLGRPQGASREEQARTSRTDVGGWLRDRDTLHRGALHLVVVDLSRSSVTSRRIRSFPHLYHSPSRGVVAVHQPVALARSGIIDVSPDFTAMASGPTSVHARGPFPPQGIRIVRPIPPSIGIGKIRWVFIRESDSPWKILPGKTAHHRKSNRRSIERAAASRFSSPGRRISRAPARIPASSLHLG